MNKMLGAMAPPEMEWQLGKTAGSIVADNLVEELLQDETVQEEHERLRKFREELRSGIMIYDYIPNRMNVLDTAKLVIG